MCTHKLGFTNDNRVKKKTRADIHGVCVLKSCSECAIATVRY